MPVNNQTVHAVAAFVGAPPAFTVLRSDGCVLTNPGVGQYRVTVPAGFGAQGPNLKVTANATGPGGAATIVNIAWISQTVLDVVTFDAGGIAADVDGIWITVEIVPRVS